MNALKYRFKNQGPPKPSFKLNCKFRDDKYTLTFQQKPSQVTAKDVLKTFFDETIKNTFPTKTYKDYEILASGKILENREKMDNVLEVKDTVFEIIEEKLTFNNFLRRKNLTKFIAYPHNTALFNYFLNNSVMKQVDPPKYNVNDLKLARLSYNTFYQVVDGLSTNKMNQKLAICHALEGIIQNNPNLILDTNYVIKPYERNDRNPDLVVRSKSGDFVLPITIFTTKTPNERIYIDRELVTKTSGRTIRLLNEVETETKKAVNEMKEKGERPLYGSQNESSPVKNLLNSFKKDSKRISLKPIDSQEYLDYKKNLDKFLKKKLDLKMLENFDLLKSLSRTRKELNNLIQFGLVTNLYYWRFTMLYRDNLDQRPDTNCFAYSHDIPFHPDSFNYLRMEDQLSEILYNILVLADRDRSAISVNEISAAIHKNLVESKVFITNNTASLEENEKIIAEGKLGGANEPIKPKKSNKKRKVRSYEYSEEILREEPVLFTKDEIQLLNRERKPTPSEQSELDKLETESYKDENGNKIFEHPLFEGAIQELSEWKKSKKAADYKQPILKRKTPSKKQVEKMRYIEEKNKNK